MRLHILSDLHLEFEPFTPPAVESDAVILAGDVSTGRNGVKWALKAFADRPVIYVLGNHEFYGQKLQKLVADLKGMARGTNVHLLENESCTNLSTRPPDSARATEPPNRTPGLYAVGEAMASSGSMWVATKASGRAWRISLAMRPAI